MQAPRQNWDPDGLSQQFLLKAEGAERYLNELRGKLDQTKSYELIYDEALATFYVFNYLHGRTFVQSRESLLSELRSFLDSDVRQPDHVFDLQRFLNFRKQIIQGLIAQFEGSTNQDTQEPAPGD